MITTEENVSSSTTILVPESEKTTGLSWAETLSVEDILSKDQLKAQNHYINVIKVSIERDLAAFVFGAGVSVPSGMPMWSGLISQMFGYSLQNKFLNETSSMISLEKIAKLQENNSVANKLINKEIKLLGNVNSLESAEYVAQFFMDDSAEEWVKNKLSELAIATMVSKLIDKSHTPEALFEKDVHSCTRLLAEEVADTTPSVVAKKNTMFAVSYLMAAEKGIHRAMTYNYDPLVQEHMMELYGIPHDRILTHPSNWNKSPTSGGNREIYHVHGFVKGQRHNKPNHESVYPGSDQSGPLVLSEDSYYRIEQREAYNWSSSIQSYFLNKYNCIFVGFSADDYNFRRIIRQLGDSMSLAKPPEERTASNSHPLHYLVLGVGGLLKDVYESVCKSYRKNGHNMNTTEEKQAQQETIFLMQNILESRARYWKRFGVVPIWVTTEEIPELLVSFLEK